MSGHRAQADFDYHPTGVARGVANDPAGLPLTVSVFADRSHVRAGILDDALAAGLRQGQVGSVDDLLGGEACSLGEVVLLDCPVVDGRALAALARLDMRIANSGAQLVISTSVDALDDVFGCLDQSAPQILVDPARSERVIALGRVLAKMPNMRLRDLSDDDRITLLRLTEQVGQIAERLERLGADGKSADGGAFRFESPTDDFSGQESEDGSGRLVRKVRPSLPDPRLVRRIVRQRQLRARFFDGDLFADPAWDILLDLTAARAEHTRVSVTSLCIASGVPPTTALRWISQMVDAGLLERVEDEADKRRAFIALSDRAADAMARYFIELKKDAAALV
ncbi:winged helix DNA-binding protein [Altererythrobacter luteolus]|uniref:Winged helix DNA-binding protein n=1 Tax=Pontixanthobacter luteolus TaxID=295089 RepID=A0A6I4V1L6_9SPHN|nr:winged helix DNA-binding protein [Pontixanthobacter luteolus]MXP47161.1 winged helix DNA-binding protein [Pontixanthobacter luteolus]